MNNPEHNERWLEYMGMRNRNAHAALDAEKALVLEPTEKSLAYQQASAAILPLLQTFSQARLFRERSAVLNAIKNYLTEKSVAKKQETQLKKDLQERGESPSPRSMGEELFLRQTGSDPIKSVRAERIEGYFVLTIPNKIDFFTFVDELPDTRIASYHSEMKFSGQEMNIIVRRSLDDDVMAHERQHFINDNILQKFDGIERKHPPEKAIFPALARSADLHPQEFAKRIANIKDEMLARVRDGSNGQEITSFWSEDVYEYLRDGFSRAEKAEIAKLLRFIMGEHYMILPLFPLPDERALLVYHLVDTPLWKMPTMVRAVREYQLIIAKQ